MTATAFTENDWEYIGLQRTARRLSLVIRDQLRIDTSTLDGVIADARKRGHEPWMIQAALARVRGEKDWRKGLRGRPSRKLVFQPEGSNLCGQASVAMVAGLTLEESVEAFRREGAPAGLTMARHLRKVLSWFHLEMGPALRLPRTVLDKTTGQVDLEGTWVCRMRWPGRKKTHWVVVDRHHLLDPGTEQLLVLTPSVPHDDAMAALVTETGAYLSAGYRITREDS